jgi:electron transfer flavoprotein beta subunit
MKALVGVKRCLDYAIKVRVNSTKTGVELKGLKQSINPFDEIAVEEALKMREAG